jgi:hypothetical protein
MSKPSDGSDIRVAKITSMQAIAVASITAIAGVVGTLLTSHHFDPASGHWHRIIIDQVSYEAAEPRTAIRLVLETDGQAYSYPSRTLWADIVGNISQESFPVPPSAGGYKIHIEAYLRHPDGKVEFLQSQVVVPVSESAIPFAGDYQLHPVDEGFMRGTPSPVIVRYRIE